MKLISWHYETNSQSKQEKHITSHCKLLRHYTPTEKLQNRTRIMTTINISPHVVLGKQRLSVLHLRPFISRQLIRFYEMFTPRTNFSHRRLTHDNCYNLSMGMGIVQTHLAGYVTYLLIKYPTIRDTVNCIRLVSGVFEEILSETNQI